MPKFKVKTTLPKQILKLGTHRNNRRIWLDKEDLLVGAGFKAGELYYDNYNFETQTIKLRLHDEGNRKVSKKTKFSTMQRKYGVGKGVGRDVPVIDLNSTKVGYALGNIDAIEVHYKQGLITIKPYEEK